MTLQIKPSGPLIGEIQVPGDKSITHRAFFLAAAGASPLLLRRPLMARDSMASLSCLRSCGLEVEALESEESLRLQLPPEGLHAPTTILRAGNSGTTARLLIAFLASRGLAGTVDGDDSLRRRPMGRILLPLQKAGANIRGQNHDRHLPVHLRPSRLGPLRHDSPVASAQVKTALLFAALATRGRCQLSEPHLSRDHTERLFRAAGLTLDSCHEDSGRHVLSLEGPQTPHLHELDVPGDLSSAAPFVVAASCLPGSDLRIRNVGVNPSRRGLLDVLERMGASIETLAPRETEGGEAMADLRVRWAPLRSTTVEAHEFPRLLDEVPLLAMAAARAEGCTRIRGLGELRIKESDRLGAIECLLDGFAVAHRRDGEDLLVTGPATFRAWACPDQEDHRMAMAAAVAALLAEGPCSIEGEDAVSVSFPGFFHILSTLTGAVEDPEGIRKKKEEEMERLWRSIHSPSQRM